MVMITLRFETVIPESREITLILPPETPTGKAEIEVRAGERPAPIEVQLPAGFPHRAVKDQKWEREFQAFLRLLPDLLTTHRAQYVAVHNGQVVAAGPDKVQVALQ